MDFDYWRYGNLDLNIDMGCCFYPPVKELSMIFEQNRKSMIEYLKLANTGIRGIVKFEDEIRAKHVTIKIDGRNPFIKTNKNGEYFKILLPGKYSLRVGLDCKDIYETVFEISNKTRLIEFNITLSNKLFRQYRDQALNRYPVFCSTSYILNSSFNLIFLTNLFIIIKQIVLIN